MEGDSAKLTELLYTLQGRDRDGADDSRATSPGPAPADSEGADEKEETSRSRPRTFPYTRYLPYEVESNVERQGNFEEILKYLYVAVEAGDFAVGAAHWTRELRNWLSLKFDPTKNQRIRLVKLYYELALAPGIDMTAVERFSSMFNVLLKWVRSDLDSEDP